MPSGIEIKAAVKKASAWGTAVACGANDGVLLTGDTLKRSVESLTADDLGLAFARGRDQGNIKAGGAMSASMRYDGLDLLIALAMGETGGAPTQPDAVNDPNTYRQVFKLADLVDGLFATVAVNKAVNVMEYPGAKVSGFTIKGETGGVVGAEFDIVADDEAADSETNDLTSFASVTWFETGHRVLMSHGTFRMNDRDGSALSAGDAIRPSSFELSFKRKLEGKYVVGGDDRIDEPTSEGQPEITLKLSFPRYTSAAYLADLGSDTRKKADITFEGAVIDVNYKRSLKFSFPHLALVNAEAATSKGQIVHPLEFVCLAAESAPSGMAGITLPFQLDATNRRASDVLA